MCHADATVTGYWYVGGLAGISQKSIRDSYSSGSVTGASSVGGLVGYNYSDDDSPGIGSSYSLCAVTGEGVVGGLVGWNIIGISESFAKGNVNKIASANPENNVCFGGLVGMNYGPIENSYAWGDVDGFKATGGLVGHNVSRPTTRITKSYSIGKVTGISDVGGLVGLNDPGVAVNGSFWNSNTSELTESSGGIGRPTAEMKMKPNYDDEGWDFESIWNITDTGGGYNNGYPFLRWESDYGPSVVPTSLNITEGSTGTFTINIGESIFKATRADITSNDTGIATVDQASVNTSSDITVTGVSEGSTTLTVSFIGGSYIDGDISINVTVTSSAPVVHTVNFYSAGSIYATKTVISGTAIGAEWPADPIRSDYIFGGWFTGTHATGTQYTSASIITGDVDLYARWTYIGVIPPIPPAPEVPIYRADVTTGSGTETTLPVTVDNDAGTASVDVNLQSNALAGTVITIPSISGITTFSAGIPVSELSKDEVEGTLTLQTDAGSITVPSNMLTDVSGADGEKAMITIGRADASALPADVRDQIGDRPLIQLTLSIDGRHIDWNNKNAPVLVSIPYVPTPEELENPECIIIWYIDGSGNLVCVPNGHYDPVNGVVTFTTTHFSYYAVGYNSVEFGDVPGTAWYSDAVSFIAARGITTGTGDGNFSPDAGLTRGQFIVMLMRAYDIAPDTDPTDNFADAGNTYYTGYLAAAKRLNVSAGVGNNMFAPDKEITRQEMFTLLYNALEAIGRLPQGKSGKTLSDFGDADSIASWAKDEIAYLVEAGMIQGINNNINPTGNASRAEFAQMLYNILRK